MFDTRNIRYRRAYNVAHSLCERTDAQGRRLDVPVEELLREVCRQCGYDERDGDVRDGVEDAKVGRRPRW